MCPICFSKSHPSFKIKEFIIFSCNICGHQFLDTMDCPDYSKLYDDTYFIGAKGGYLNYLANQKNLVKQGEWYAKLLKKYLVPGVMLDVGCASGHILKGFVNEGWKGIGLEPNRSMVEYGRKFLDLQLEEGTLETFQTDLKFDLIAMIEVFIHFINIRQSLEIATFMIKTGGFLLIETWKRDSLVAKMSGLKWHVYNPPTIRNWFDHKGLNNLVLQYGFEEISYGRRLKKIRGDYSKSLIDNPLLKLFLNLIPNDLNIPYLGDDLFWTLYRKK